MTFVDHIVTGYRSVILSFGLVWNHRVLLVYPLLGYLIGSLIFSVGSLVLGFGIFGIYKVLNQWVMTMRVTEGLYILGVVSCLVILLSWIKVIFEAALLKHGMFLLHDKKIRFNKSFDFEKGLGRKLFVWSILFVVVVLLIGLLPALIHHALTLYIASILLAVWLVGIVFVIPLLIKRNEKIGKAIFQSFFLAWKHFPGIFTAAIVMAFFVLLSGFLFGTVGMSVTWLVCHLLNVPIGAGLILPFILIAIIPVILLSWYFVTVFMALPAVLFHSIMMKK